MYELKPQGYAVELFFDQEMEKAILAFRESIYQMGITPVLGKLNDRPHVSLAVFGDENIEKLIAITSSFIKGQKQFTVQLDTFGAFPTNSNVLYLLPVPTLKLLTLHKNYHTLLRKEKIHSSRYYLPNQWVPHCTLEFEISDEQLDLALQLCKRHFSPIRGWFTSLGVIAFRPIDYLAEYPLTIQE